MNWIDTVILTLQTAEAAMGTNTTTGAITFTWNGVDYPCTTGTGAEDALLGMGGFSGDIKKGITVRSEVFPDAIYPVKSDIITMDGIDYEIDKISDNGSHTFFRIHLVEPNP